MKRIKIPNINTPETFNKLFTEQKLRNDPGRYDRIIEVVRDGMKVVELGCGNSLLLSKLKERWPNCKVHGLDFSSVAIGRMKKMFPNIQYICGNFLHTPYEDEDFDAVLGGEILEHVENPDDLIKEMVRICKNGGILSLSTPFKAAYAGPYHLWQFDEEDIKKLFGKYGKVKTYLLGNRYIIIHCKVTRKIARPIFIITCDRLKVLQESIKSYYDHIKTPFEIVIRDQGSSFKPTIEFLKNLESRGTKIYWAERITHHSELNKLDESIQDYFKTHPRSNYVVTDGDIALDNAGGDILEVYAYLLNLMPKINVVSSMLRIDDIPDCYPLKEKILKDSPHKSYNSRPVATVDYKGKQIKYIFAAVDSTFGMYRKGTRWKMSQEGIRTYPPYSARHLDWYVDPKNLTEDQKHYMKHSSKEITHWSSWTKN